MRISKGKESDILEFLQWEASNGKKWVVYNADAIIKSNREIQCFLKDFEASQYVHDNNTHFDKPGKHSLITSLKSINKLMNTQNLEYLQSNLKYFGFGDKLNDSLEKNIKDQKHEFQLKLEIPHFNNKMDYTLHFKKSDSSDMYFFNKYDASLKNENPKNDRAQSFYINKGNGVTAKEAFNLLEGRSVSKDLVNKDGEKYSAWLKLDFENRDDKGNFKLKQFSEQYGYNLEKTLKGFPIKELNDPEQKKNLVNSLEKGNVQQVSMIHDNKEGKYYIEAVPQFKNINLFDSKMHLLKRQNFQKVDSGISRSIEKPLRKAEEKKEVENQSEQKQTKKRKLKV